jgi:hypothetical protein
MLFVKSPFSYGKPSNINGNSRMLDAEKIKDISTENDFVGVHSILTIYHIYICFSP